MVQKEFNVPKHNILCVGDELDMYFGSHYPRDPDARMSAMDEIDASIRILKEWYAKFPNMHLCTSNHGMRWIKKALAAEIPSQLLKGYREIIDAPDTWQWKDEWIFKAKNKTFRMIHGSEYSGQMGARNAALDSKLSTLIGHIHSFGGVSHVRTNGYGEQLWAMNTGCLIDVKQFAFQYSRANRNQPTLGCGVVLDGGKTPLFVPLE
jgi:hypothetical protein